ncbi:MAG: phage integrase N-terminal SAM-like domain-containing protein [Pirellulaceae bacterium]
MARQTLHQQSAVDTATKPKLLDRAWAAARVRDVALGTEKAYVHWIRRSILFHGKRHPTGMGKQEVSDFLTHLAVVGKVSNSTQNQVRDVPKTHLRDQSPSNS